MVIQDNGSNSFEMKVKLEPSEFHQRLQHQLQPELVVQQQQHQVLRRDSVSLSDYYSDNEPNDLDFNELAKISQYRQAIEIIKRKCEALSKDNEKLVRR